MPTRVRTRFGGVTERYYRNNNTGLVILSPSQETFDSCQDEVTPGQNQPLRIKKVQQSGGVLNREGIGGFSHTHRNYRLDAYASANSSFFNNLWQGITGEPTLGTMATRLLAMTNPSRPIVDLPLLLIETLKDLPSLLRVEGNTLIQRAASLNLNYQFGIAPLVSDLGKLLDFTQQVALRTQELKALHKGGLRRKRTLWQASAPITLSSAHQSANAYIYGTHFVTQTGYYWGTVKWYPTTTPPATEGDMLSLARRAVLGLTIDFSTAWNLIPWSWLVDWCSNTGQYLIAHRNIVGAVPKYINIMRQRKVEATCRYTPAYSDVSDHQCSVVWKMRDRATPSLSAHLPFLSLRQLSILGSIGVLRRVPRSSIGGG